MRTRLRAAAAIVPAAIALAAVGPITAHANGVPGGTCYNGKQSTGFFLSQAHHAFDDSSNNCVVFDGYNDFAYLHDDSNNNLVLIYGNHSGLDELTHSSHNFIEINGNNDTVGALNSYGNTGIINGSNDVIQGVGLIGGNVTIASDVMNDFIDFTAGCNVFGGSPQTVNQDTVDDLVEVGGHGNNTASSPVVIC